MRIRTVALSVAATLAALGVGALAFIYSGAYDIAASTPHLPPVRWAITTLQVNAVRRSADGIAAPPLHDAPLIRRGFVLYDTLCVVCHGAPAVPPEPVGFGINPNPPPLNDAGRRWNDAELFWITKHGLRMAGMPAFGLTFADSDIWALVAFTRRLERTSPAEYASMRAVRAGSRDPSTVEWVALPDPEAERMRTRAEPAAGRKLLVGYGCGACHVVPGVPGALGTVGPSLARWSERGYIAGTLTNEPGNLVRWITAPQSIEPETAMPDLGVSEDAARHIAAYLFSLD